MILIIIHINYNRFLYENHNGGVGGGDDGGAAAADGDGDICTLLPSSSGDRQLNVFPPVIWLTLCMVFL